MSSIPGPIISFRVSSDISGSIRPALDQIKREARNTSQQIADDWKRMAAQIRATTALGTGTEQQIAASRKELVSILDKEIAGLRTRNELTTKELANLKAQTLERERQLDAIKRGSAVGITAGTSSALNQVSTQTVLGIERVLDSLVNRYFGGAAGAAFRTARDVQYYSAQASGNRSSLFTGTNLAVLGGIGAVGISAAAIAATAVAGGKLAVELDNTAKKMGLTTDAAIRLRSAAEAIDIPFDSLAPTFKKFSTELTLATTASLPNASKEAQKAGELFKILGVNVKEAAANPLVGLQQLAKSLNALPDGAIKSATANLLFGKSYETILPVLSKLPGALDATKKSSEDLAKALGTDVLHSADALRAGLINWKNESDAFEIALAQNVLPTLVKFVGLINDVGAATRSALTPVAREQSEIGGFLRSRNQQLTPLGTSQLGLFLTAQNQASRSLNPFDLSTKLDNYTGNPQRAISDFLSSKEGQGTGILEPFKQSISGVGDVSKGTAKELKALAGVVSNLGDGSEKAAKKAAQLAKEYDELIYKAVTRPGRVGRGGGGSGGEEEHVDVLIDRFLKYGTVYRSQVPIIPPANGVLSSPFAGGAGGFTNYLAGIVPPVGGPPKGAPNLLGLISGEHDELFKTQRETDIEHYNDELKDLNDALHNQLISQQQYSEALIQLTQNRNKTLADIDKKYEDEASHLFDDLLGGKGKDFAKSFQKDIINIVTQPIREIFSQFIGGIFGNLSRAVQGPFGGATGISGIGSKLGGIFGGLGGLGTSGGRIGPGGTAGWWPGQIGGGVSGAAGAPSVGVSAGQVGVATPVMNVHADIVNLSGSLGLPGTGPLGAGTGNFFGNLNPFANNAIGGPIAIAGLGATSPSGLSSAISSAGPYVGAAALIGAGIASNNPTAMALGAAKLAQSGIQSLTQFGGLISSSSGLGQALGTIAPALPGIGLFAGGVAQGGIGGTLEATAGGAQAGLTLGGPVGAAIGAGVGLISGIVSTLIQGQSFAERVKQNMYNQAYRLPPSEQFSFAMGNSIQQTLSTGFNQSGSTFGTYGLAANTPFFANPITGRLSRDQQIDLARSQLGILSNQPFGGFPTNDPFVGQGNIGRYKGTGTPNVNFNITAIDQKGVADFVTEHGSTIARMLNSSTPYSSSSGFGSAARRVTALP